VFGGAHAEALFTAGLLGHRARMLDDLLAALPAAQRAPLLASLRRELSCAAKKGRLHGTVSLR
jgi:hypothetical protein